MVGVASPPQPDRRKDPTGGRCERSIAPTWGASLDANLGSARSIQVARPVAMVLSVALGLSVGAGCREAELIFVAPPPLDGVGSVLFVTTYSNGAVPRAAGGPTADEIHILLPLSSTTAQIYALGFECDSLVSLGFEILRDEVAFPAGARIRAPTRVFQTTAAADGSDAWRALPAVPEDLTSRLDVEFAEPTPCLELQGRPAGLTLEHDGASIVRLNDSAVAIAQAGGRLFVVEPELRTQRVELSTSAPTGALFVSESELWMYGEGGGLWHAPIADLETGDFTIEPPNPFWGECDGQAYGLVGGPVGDPVELFVIGMAGGIARYDLLTRSWSRILDNDPPTTRIGAGGLFECAQRRTAILWRGVGDVVAVRSTAGELVRYDPASGLVAERPTIGRFPLERPQQIADIPGLGLLIGTGANQLLRRNGVEEWEVLLEEGVLFEEFDFRPMHAIGDGAVLWTGDAGTRVYHRDFGSCRSNAYPDFAIRDLIPLGEGFVAIPSAVRGGRRTLLRLDPAPKDLCRADPD